MKIIFDPIRSGDNRYVKIIVDSLKERGFEVLGLKDVLKTPLLFFKVEVIHLNWFESLRGSSHFFVTISFLKQYFKLLFFKLFRIKIIWTMHNKKPHDTAYSFFKKRIFKKVAQSSHGVIIHSLISKKILVDELNINPNKIHYCPHPNYINEYGNIIDNRRKNENLRLLFFGMLRPYKNIELLMEVVDEIKDLDVELRIVGKPETEKYGSFLKEYKSNNKSIKIELGFLKDNMIPKYFSECDLLVIPLNFESSLNSGSAILAFSYKKTVICPEIGTIKNLNNKDLVYTYSYTTIDQHKKRLKETIYKAFSERKTKFGQKGEELFKLMETKYNSENVVDLLSEVYGFSKNVNKINDESC